MRLKMGSRRARDVSIGLDMDGGGLAPPLLLLLPKLSESKSEAKEPTGDGESNSGINLPVETIERFKLLLLLVLLLLLLLNPDE